MSTEPAAFSTPSDSDDWTGGVVAILNSSGAPVGAGFVATVSGLIVTCAHVLDDAGWPFGRWDKPVQIRFHATGRHGRGLVVQEYFRPKIDEDVAILQLDGDVPTGVAPLNLTQSTGAVGHTVRMFGYPQGEQHGLHGRGEVFGPVRRDRVLRLQIWSEQSTDGYSGGPLWNPLRRGVVGIVHSGRQADAAGRHAFTGYAILAETLYTVCNELPLAPPPANDASPQEMVDAANALSDALIEVENLPTDRVPAPAPLPAGSHVPVRPNPLFVGRNGELRELAALLKEGVTAAATGMGGIGKTQLAAEFVHRYGQYFAGGVLWLSFADPAGVPAEIAAAGQVLALPAYDARSVPDQVTRVRRAWQAPLPRLLVFDNCEDPALADQYRPTTGGCRVLITSRRGTWDKSLDIRSVNVARLPRPQSIELLQKHVDGLDETDAAAIAAELGDLPLALHLAGAFLATYGAVVSPGRYVRQLRERALLDHPSLRGRPEVHSPTHHEHDVGRTFALSYKRLDPARATDQMALDLLYRAACFAAGEVIPRELLLATVDGGGDDLERQLAAVDGARRLQGLGLLEAAGDGYRLHRLLAAFVLGLPQEEAMDRARKAVEETVLGRASQINQEGRPGRLLPWREHLRAVTDRALLEQDYTAANLSSELGFHLRSSGNYAASLTYFHRALTIFERVQGPDHPAIATCLNNMGGTLQQMGRLDEARTYFDRALAIRQKALGSEHPDTASCLNNLGFLLEAMYRLEEANLYYQRALAIREKALGPDHPTTAITLGNIGSLLQKMDRLREARLYFERTLAIREKTLGPDHPHTATSLNNMGSLLQAMGHLDEAYACYERALAVHEASLGSDHPHTATSFNNIGGLLSEMGFLDEARPYYDRALAIFYDRLGADHPHTQTVQRNLQRLLAEPANGGEA